MSSITVIPFHGRDYKSRAEIEADWNANKDFIIADVFNQWDGKAVNKQDIVNHGSYTSVTFRYRNLRNVHVLYL